MVITSDISSLEEYKEIEEDTVDEMSQYGKVLKVVTPRPEAGAAIQPIGVGVVYVRFEGQEACIAAQKTMSTRRFDGRMIIANFYPESKFDNNLFDREYST